MVYWIYRFICLFRQGTESCFIWDMGDGSDLTVYGGDHCTKYITAPSDDFLPIPTNNPLQVSNQPFLQN